MPEITRRLEIDAGHRLLKHDGKCKNYHGHRYVVEVSCYAPTLDACGRVIDFSVIKAVFGQWLDDNWDHGMILQSGDPLIDFLLNGAERGLVDAARGLVNGAATKLYILDAPPTAETLSEYAFHKARTLLTPHGVLVTRVRIYETPNCWADAPDRERA